MLSLRKRGPDTYEFGPAGHGPTVMVTAPTKPEAIVRGKRKLREAGLLAEARAQTFRDNLRICTRRSEPVVQG
jgi:hypothetical protein